VDLQLAYLAAPASAAAANSVEQVPTTAAQATQAAFAAQVDKREETIEESAHTENARLRADADGGGNDAGYSSRKRRNGRGEEDASRGSSDGEKHFIDTTA
jgi:hypothetical protein